MSPTRRIRIVCLALSFACVALAPATASAKQSPVIKQCIATGTVTGHFSVAQLQAAASELPVDDSQYGPCLDAIHRALLAAAATGSGHASTTTTTSGSGGSSFLPTWLIVVIIVVILGGGGATLAARRRRTDDGAPPQA